LQPVNQETVSQAQQSQDRADTQARAQADAMQSQGLSATDAITLARFAVDLSAANDHWSKSPTTISSTAPPLSMPAETRSP